MTTGTLLTGLMRSATQGYWSIPTLKYEDRPAVVRNYVGDFNSNVGRIYTASWQISKILGDNYYSSNQVRSLLDQLITFGVPVDIEIEDYQAEPGRVTKALVNGLREWALTKNGLNEVEQADFAAYFKGYQEQGRDEIRAIFESLGEVFNSRNVPDMIVATRVKDLLLFAEDLGQSLATAEFALKNKTNSDEKSFFNRRINTLPIDKFANAHVSSGIVLTPGELVAFTKKDFKNGLETVLADNAIQLPELYGRVYDLTPKPQIAEWDHEYGQNNWHKDVELMTRAAASLKDLAPIEHDRGIDNEHGVLYKDAFESQLDKIESLLIGEDTEATNQEIYDSLEIVSSAFRRGVLNKFAEYSGVPREQVTIVLNSPRHQEFLKKAIAEQVSWYYAEEHNFTNEEWHKIDELTYEDQKNEPGVDTSDPFYGRHNRMTFGIERFLAIIMQVLGFRSAEGSDTPEALSSS